MLQLKKIAVTGGLSSGKTTVCRILHECGAFVMDADEVVHHLLSTHSDLHTALIDLLGTDVLAEDGQLHRGKIAEKVFTNQQLLFSLEKLIHPLVKDEICQRYHHVKHTKHYPFFVVEVPLLFESTFDDFFDVIISVIADKQLCQQRFATTTGYDNAEYNRRMEKHLPVQEKASLSHFVITNNAGLSELREATDDVYQKITTYRKLTP